MKTDSELQKDVMMAFDFAGAQPVEFQGYHTNQASYESGIMARDTTNKSG